MQDIRVGRDLRKQAAPAARDDRSDITPVQIVDYYVCPRRWWLVHGHTVPQGSGEPTVGTAALMEVLAWGVFTVVGVLAVSLLVLVVSQ